MHLLAGLMVWHTLGLEIKKGGEAWCFTIPGRALPRFTLYVEELKPRLFFL